MLFADLRFEFLAASTSIMDVRKPSAGHAVAGLAESERNDDGRRLTPRYDAGDICGGRVFGIVPRRVEGESGSCKPVGIFVAVAVEKPMSEAFEVGRAVTAAASTFDDGDDCDQQPRNGGPLPGFQV